MALSKRKKCADSRNFPTPLFKRFLILALFIEVVRRVFKMAWMILASSYHDLSYAASRLPCRPNRIWPMQWCIASEVRSSKTSQLSPRSLEGSVWTNAEEMGSLVHNWYQLDRYMSGSPEPVGVRNPCWPWLQLIDQSKLEPPTKALLVSWPIETARRSSYLSLC